MSLDEPKTDKSALLPSFDECNTNVLKYDLFLRPDDKEFSQLGQIGSNISRDFHQIRKQRFQSYALCRE